MRVSRLLLACFVAACSAAPLASPALAQDPEECPTDFAGLYVLSLVPPLPVLPAVEIDEETITIRGDLLAESLEALPGYYVSNTETFLTCLQQFVDETVAGLVTPYSDCIEAAAGPILTSPDPVSRYVEVGTDLVVKIHHAQLRRDVIALFNCNGIVTSG